MATPRKRTKTRTSTGGGDDGDVGKSSIFATPGSDIIPGEVIVQLSEDVAATVTQNIPRGPTRGLLMAAPSTFGVKRLDDALAKIQVTGIVRLHPPPPVVSAAMSEATVMASTFRVTFDARTKVEDAVEELKNAEGVGFVEPNRYRETCAVPNDPSFATQWGLTKINCPAAWDRTTGSANIVVAVIDTGVDLDHPELAPLLVPGRDMVDLGPNPTPPPGFRFEGDFQGRDNVPQDEVGHGTHVAGTIACSSNNGAGVAGVTWNCRIMPVRVLARIVRLTNRNDVRGTGSAADIAAGIRWAVDNGARVLNLSLGGPVDTQVERDAIAYAIAQGAVVVAAMGNAGAGAGPSFPAAYPNVVAVGAIDQADHRAGFSQIGPHIDVVGPGVDVLSTVWDNGFSTMSGTSMASPHVAGVAALVLSCNPNLTGAQAADIVRQTARPLRDNPADPIPNNNYGFGCVDALAAVNRACPPRRTIQISCTQIQPTSPIICRTTAVTCRPSIVIRCPSEAICPPTRLVPCRPSVPITTCRSNVVPCGPSQLIPCPTIGVHCLPPRPSVVIRCPSGPICGIQNPINPIENPFGVGDLQGFGEGYDPYGWGGQDSGDYDPYAGYYGDEGCCGKG